MTSFPLRAVCLALAVACLPVLPAMAAGSLYVDMAGIAGGSAAPSRPDQIDLEALSWGANRSVQIEGGRRVIGGLNVQDIAWSQAALDASTDDLFSRATTGVQVRSARFEWVDARSTGQTPLLVLDAGESVVTSLSLGSGGGDISVNGTLNASHLSLQYDPGSIGGPGTVTDVTHDAGLGVSTGSLTRAPLQPIGVAPARAGLYLRLGTGDSVIAGDNASLGHENWIAIDGFSMGASGLGGPGPLFVQDMSWTQRLDATSPVVLANLMAGTAVGQATLEQVALDATGRPVTVLQQALNDVMFTSFSLGIDTNGDASVNTTMAFNSYTQTNWVLLNDGRRIGPLSVGYDLLKGQRMTAALASDVAGFGLGKLDGTEVFNPAPIPEPQTWALLLAGLAGVLVMARRQGASRRA